MYNLHNLLKFSLIGMIVCSPMALAEPIRPNLPSPVTSPLISKRSQTMFQNLAISPKLNTDPQILQGISGGGEETTKISGREKTETGECIGFVDALPDHQITLISSFKFLNIKVLSPGDTVLLIKGPGGSWCSDDTNGRNPAIAGEWLKGTYSIWIGSYEVNSSYPYLIEVSEKP
jgi:hypothetical protein